MKSPRPLLNKLIALISLCCFSLSTPAMPKAAENEDAPVTSGADIPRPKPRATNARNAKKNVSVKHRGQQHTKPVQKSSQSKNFLKPR